MKFFDTKLKQATYSLIMTIIVIAALLITNLITETIDLQFDMTEKGLFSLSPETEQIISELNNDVTIYALFKPGRESKQILGVLDQYSSFRNIDVEIIDPDRNPAILSKFQDETTTINEGALVVDGGSYWQVIDGIDLYSINYSQAGPQVFGLKAEQKITSAISYVKTGRIPKVYEISGHNEISIMETGIDLEVMDANFELDSFSITRSSGIPEDADILLLNGPLRDLTDYETGKLDEYLLNGGKLFISLGYTDQDMTNLHSLLRAYDLEIYNGLTMERDSSRLIPEFGDNPFLFAPFLGEDSISSFIKDNQLDPLFSGSIGFTRTESEKRNISYQSIMTSSDNSWIRMDNTSQDFSSIASDIPGPVSVAVAVNQINRDTGEDEGARIVLIGSPTAFMPVGNMGILPGNIKMLIGSLIWLDNSKSNVAVPTKSLYSLPLKIDTRSALIYGGLVTIVIPLLIVICALIIYRKRKNL